MAKKLHVISSRGKTLVSVGFKPEVDLKKVSGTAEIYDGEELVISIDRKILAETITAMLAQYVSNGITKHYNKKNASVSIGYPQYN